jgi:excisionase family DNA binding protein
MATESLEVPGIASTLKLEELLDVNRAAKVLGIKPKTLRHHVLCRRIDYVKIGGRVLFRQDTLWQFIERNTIRSRP